MGGEGWGVGVQGCTTVIMCFEEHIRNVGRFEGSNMKQSIYSKLQPIVQLNVERCPHTYTIGNVDG